MVEQFFDIIYSVHVEAAGDTQIRGRAGKHCGQKRTYRAVSKKDIQLQSDETTQLLNKPYVNEVTLRGQKQPLKCW